jgi:hypothetical protein
VGKSYLGLLLLLSTFLLISLWVQVTSPRPPQPITVLISNLAVPNERDREDAAEALAEIDDRRVVPALRDRLQTESDFHVRLALHFALASQGEKSSVPELIASLRQSGHLGSVYLRRVSGKDYGWDIGRWELWDKETSAKVFQERAREWIRQLPARKEWERFISLYGAEAFEQFDPEDAAGRLSAEDRKQLAEMPTAKAWGVYESAIHALQDEGNRPLAAERFRKVTTMYSGTYYAEESRELADLLDEMVKEDRAWREPKDLSALSQSELIAYHIHHLRDVVAHQFSQPGYCNVLSSFLREEEGNAAKELRSLGQAAVPALLELLEDRRPIRAVGYWRNFHPTRTILRYQDAAIQILDEILPDASYTRRTTSSYFSNEDPNDRAKLIDKIRKSWNGGEERPSSNNAVE